MSPMNVAATIRRPVVLLHAALVLLSLAATAAIANADVDVVGPQHADMLSKGLLRKLGLEGVPVQRGPSLPIPQHVWDIYNDDETDADWVRHYYPKELLEVNTGLILSYNLSVAARNAAKEEVVRALLKLRVERKSKGQRADERITAYFFDQNQKWVLDSPRVVENFTDWVDLDVTNAFRRSPNEMVNLMVELGAGLRLATADPDSISALPFGKLQSAPLIVYSETLEPSRVRRKRSTGERKGRKKGRKHHRHDAEPHLCRKAELYVDFDLLNWQDWIMAPKGYEAGQCVGGCPHPMPAHLNASNHAIIQSLLHSLNPNEVPPPSCVPTETLPLSILYVDIDNVIVIKEYPDMRVEACGCR